MTNREKNFGAAKSELKRTLRARSVLTACLLIQGGVIAPTLSASAQEATSTVEGSVVKTPDYSGDLPSRTTLSGDWGGFRQSLANKGVTIDLELTQVGQGVVSGGVERGWEYMGRGQTTLTVDTAKLGLWPGGVLSVLAEGNFGQPLSSKDGTLIGTNANELFPEVENGYMVPQVSYTQFFSPQFAVAVGKFATLTKDAGDANEFAHGTGTRQFMNPALSFNLITALTVAYSTLGSTFLIMPSQDWVTAVSVLDPHGKPDSAGFDSLFEDGATFAAESRYTTRFFGLKGHQLLGATFSTSDYVDLDQRAVNLIIPNLPVGKASDSWSVSWNGDQYFYQPDPQVDRGVGVFGRFGKSDGQANPIEYFASAGIGGKGVVPTRELDNCGIGYFYAWSADTRITRAARFGDAQGFEAFYEIAVTPAVMVTPDIQWITPTQVGVDSSWNLGLRVYTAL